MSNTNRRKYQCEDCKNTMMLRPCELARRSRPRCSKCGCSFLVPASIGAMDQQATIGTARKLVQDAEPEIVPQAHAQMRDKGAKATR